MAYTAEGVLHLFQSKIWKEHGQGGGVFHLFKALEKLTSKVKKAATGGVSFRSATLLKKRLQQRCFSVNIAKFLRNYKKKKRNL